MSELVKQGDEQTLAQIGLPRTPNIDPSAYPKEDFELYSVPSFSFGKPEVVPGNVIGSTKQLVQPGDVLLCKIVPHLVRVWCVPRQGAHRQIASGEWIVVRPDPSAVDRHYLRYALIEPGFRGQFMDTVSGVGGSLMRARPKAVARIRVPVPAIHEQCRIVAKLDALLGRTKNAGKELARIPRLVARYKQAVLVKALKGDLTADWRDRHGCQSDKWQEKSLGEIADIGTGSTPKRGETRYYKNGTIPWVTSAAVNKPRIDAVDQFITQAALKETNCKIFPAGALLIAMYGEGQTRGRVAVLGISAATNQALAAIQIRSRNEVSADFVLWFLRANYLELRMQAAGGVQPNLNLGIIKAIRISLPSIHEQQEIVKCIEKAVNHIDMLFSEATRASDLLDRLDKATLAKAFQGQLAG